MIPSVAGAVRRKRIQFAWASAANLGSIPATSAPSERRPIILACWCGCECPTQLIVSAYVVDKTIFVYENVSVNVD